GGADLRAALDGVTLLDGVGQLVGEQSAALAGAGLVLAAREEDVVLVGERPSAELIAQARGLRIAVDADIGEIGIEVRLHVAAQVGRERLTAGGLAADRRLHVAADRRGAVASLALKLFLGRLSLLELVVLFSLGFLLGERRFLDLLLGQCRLLDLLLGRR